MPHCSIRIVYPPSGRIVLRSALDWDQDVDAESVGDDGAVHEFRLEAEASYLYFKPCLIDEAGFHWSVGTNYLAILNGGTDSRYPHFFGGLSSRISEPLEIRSRSGGAGGVVRVYCPPGYDENGLKRYPVLYMHDGRNLFFPEEAFVGREWQVDETMDLLTRMSVIDKVIVVGVYARDRMTEYTSPGYEAYGRFLVEELKQEMDRRYRTLPGPASTAIMGSSLGGVVSLHALWRWPEVFGMAGCLSSTFGYRDDCHGRTTTAGGDLSRQRLAG